MKKINFSFIFIFLINFSKLINSIELSNSSELIDDNVEVFSNSVLNIPSTTVNNITNNVNPDNITNKCIYKCFFYEHDKCFIIDNIIFGIISSNITIVSILIWYILYSVLCYTCCVYNKHYFIKNILRKS